MKQDRIIILITCKNCINSIFRTIESIERQTYKNFVILVSEDISNELMQSKKFIYYKKYIPISYWKVNFGKVYKNRNFLLTQAKQFSNDGILVRCDSDDYFNNEYVLRDIYKNFETFNNYRKRCSILLGSNAQITNSKIIKFNIATSLKKITHFLDKLACMKDAFFECELPSSNLVYKNYLGIYYPKLISAEDHFLLLKTFLYYKWIKFRVDEDLIMINYSLNGNVTNKNKKSQFYLNARNFLFEYFKRSLGYDL